MFTGRRVDILDNGSLKIQYNRNRYLDYYTGRWLTEDPAGYVDGMNLYEYTKSQPIIKNDSHAFWGKKVHYTNTERWARIVGYKRGGCSKIIAKACNSVDSGSTSPRPWGDYSYHFDTDKKGEIYRQGARDERIQHHMNKAKKLANTGKHRDVGKALKELGTALHPLQDKFSHNSFHSASMPKYHAPKWWCRLKGWDHPLHPKNWWCKNQKKNNPNWNDSHRPDKINLWVHDHTQTRIETQNVLKEFMKSNRFVRCRCYSGISW